MRTSPKDPAAPRTLEKFSILLCDKRRDEGNGIIVRERHEEVVAIRASIASLVVHGQIDREVLVELTQLTYDIVADDQRVTTAEELAKH